MKQFAHSSLLPVVIVIAHQIALLETCKSNSETSSSVCISSDRSPNNLYVGDTFELNCSIESASRDSAVIEWKWQPALFQTQPKVITDIVMPPGALLNTTRFDTSNRLIRLVSIIKWLNIKKTAAGTYFCRDPTAGIEKRFNINVLEVPTFRELQPSKDLIDNTSGEKASSAVLHSGSRFKLACNSSEDSGNESAIEWLLPPNEAYHRVEYYERNNVIPLQERTLQYKDPKTNHWIVEVRNASYLDTGLYTCVNRANNMTVFRYYLFIKDSKQWMLPPTDRRLSSDSDQTGVVVYYSQKPVTTLLGCAPTDPSVTIDIRDSQEKKLASSSDSNVDDAWTWTFNPLQGFQLNAANSWAIQGEYFCLPWDPSKKQGRRNLNIKVVGVEIIAGHKQNELYEFEKLDLTCRGRSISGSPQLKWHWHPHPSNHLSSKNQTSLSNFLISWNCTQSHHEQDGFSIKRILCQTIPLEATGSFECRDTNDLNAPVAVYNLTILKAQKPGTIAAIAVVSLLVLLACGAFFVFRRRRMMMNNDIKYNFAELLEGNENQINPDTSLDGQAELLPYDFKWEFPQDLLTLGQQIGCGHYGRVVKAQAKGITTPYDAEMEVAVKMVKSRVDVTEIKSLVSELKILVHLGSHLNVVNLLGAVTKHLKTGHLMVIVEYCRNGNLKDFLVNNRKHFVNELHNDGYLLLRRPNRFDELEAPNEIETSGDGYVKRHYVKNGEKRRATVTTSDLIEWSFQIASGMNYLTHKKVIHGDLAARNVLLADDNVVKIADFGLARKTYESANYYKKGCEALPIRWMAIESIKDRAFSSKSDVWSFGVIVWELFSLGEEPYSDVEARQLASLLLKGERLAKPRYAPESINDVMTACWKTSADERPTFEHCEHVLGDQLDPSVRAQYKRSYDRYGYIVMGNNSVARQEPYHSRVNRQRYVQSGYLDLVGDSSV